MFTSLHGIRAWRSLHASIPSRRWIHVLLSLPPAPGQAGPVELVVDDAVISGSRGRRSLFHARAVVANELLLGRAGLTPVELPATGEPGDREHGNHQDARDTRRALDHLHSVFVQRRPIVIPIGQWNKTRARGGSWYDATHGEGRFS